MWPRLRELGIAQRAYVLTKAEAKSEGRLIEYGVHRRAKSPNNSYALTDDARKLLQTSDANWPKALDDFVTGDADRRLRVLQAETTVACNNERPFDANKSCRRRATGNDVVRLQTRLCR